MTARIPAMRALLSSLALLLLAGVAQATQTPHQVVETTVTNIARQIETNRDQLSSDRRALYALIDRELLPRFDTDYAGRLVLGKSWRDATPEQRKRFVDAFYNFLLRSYSTAILKFDETKVRILPARTEPRDGRAVVETQMRLADGSSVPVVYAMRETPTGWKAYDVRIEGISYVQNYRNQFNAEAAAKGLDSLIQRLERDTAEIDAGRREPDKPVARK